MSEHRSGLHSILAHPVMYRGLQWLVGTPRLRKFVFDRLRFPKAPKVLDIGCGPGDLLRYIPADAEYTGFDTDASSIAYARRRHGARGRFLRLDVNERERLKHLENQCDVVLLFSVLHHLNNEDAREALEFASACLKVGGVAVSVDGVYLESQSRVAKYLLSKDRGRHVRHADEYLRLVKQHFDDVDVHIERSLLRMPTDVIIMTMRGADLRGPAFQADTRGHVLR